jgi:hypothetical protein
MTAKIDLQPGDIFCTSNPMALGILIRWVQTFNSVDNSAFVSHAGVIMGPRGRTYEAVWTVTSRNLYEHYAGEHALIGRHRGMTRQAYRQGIKRIMDKHGGGVYPFLRLPLIGLFPRLSKYIYWGRPVCSELAFKFLKEAGIITYWRGVTPDHIADAIRRWREFQIVYDGIVPSKGENHV